jgi:hypothetical protein
LLPSTKALSAVIGAALVPTLLPTANVPLPLVPAGVVAPHAVVRADGNTIDAPDSV